VTPKFTYILRNFQDNMLTVNFRTGDEWSDIFGSREQAASKHLDSGPYFCSRVFLEYDTLEDC